MDQLEGNNQGISFGGIHIDENRIFYDKKHVFAMVLHNQICEGHILLAPKQTKLNYNQMKTPQLFEMILAIKELSSIIEKANETKQGKHRVEGISVVIQEFDHADKSDLYHLRVHLIPRRQRDNLTNELMKQRLATFA